MLKWTPRGAQTRLNMAPNMPQHESPSHPDPFPRPRKPDVFLICLNSFVFGCCCLLSWCLKVLREGAWQLPKATPSTTRQGPIWPKQTQHEPSSLQFHGLLNPLNFTLKAKSSQPRTPLSHRISNRVQQVSRSAKKAWMLCWLPPYTPNWGVQARLYTDRTIRTLGLKFRFVFVLLVHRITKSRTNSPALKSIHLGQLVVFLGFENLV